MSVIEDKLDNIAGLVLGTLEKLENTSDSEVIPDAAVVGKYLNELFKTSELSDAGCTLVGLLYTMEALSLIEFKENK